jgi:hypothetical protein
MERVNGMNWRVLHSGALTRDEINKAIRDPEWQEFRKSLKGLSTAEKLKRLDQWKRKHNNSRKAQVQITNYLNALKRGGLIR